MNSTLFFTHETFQQILCYIGLERKCTCFGQWPNINTGLEGEESERGRKESPFRKLISFNSKGEKLLNQESKSLK